MRPRIALAAAALALLAAPAHAGEAPGPRTGETLWVSPGSPIRVCGEPGGVWLIKTGCREYRSGSFTVGNAMFSLPAGVSPPGINQGYRVTFQDGKAGWVSSTDVTGADRQAAHAKLTAAAADCRQRGQPDLGMIKPQVYASCWGKPARINTTRTTAGTYEQLVYPGGRYVYLRDGIVTSIQTSR